MRDAAAAGLVLACFLAVAGCASYGTRMAPVLDAVRAEDYGRALKRLEKHPDRGSVLYLSERALLLRYAGHLEESNAGFAAAEARQEELFTRSVSNEAASLAVSDALRPYRAARYELPFLHFYPILNYLELGDLEGALVEARALSESLEMARSERGDPADDWGLGRMLAALVFESTGEWNDADVAWRAAAAAFEAAGETVPEVVHEGVAWAEDPGRKGDRADPHLVVVFEEGMLTPLEDFHIRVPILKQEERWGPEQVDEWAGRVGPRALAVRRGDFHTEVGISYFLDVALPVYPPRTDPPVREVEVAVDGIECAPSSAVFDVDSSARADLERRYPVIAVRAAARAILKAAATKAARKSSGDVAGTVANALGVATERADTRSWSVLPARVGIAVCRPPADRAAGADPAEPNSGSLGSRRVEVSLEGGEPLYASELNLPAGCWRFVSCRIAPSSREE